MPPDQILSTFPPAMAEGDFGSRLPQIALKRRTLPWERDPGGPAPAVNDPPRPWLALVVIAEGEGALSPEPAPVAQCITPGTSIPHPEDADSPTGYYLTVTQTVVDKVFPTVEDLPLLVHVREVDVADTELANGDDDGWLAIVLANRLPIAVPHTDPDTGQPVSAPVKYLACLVNLEGQIEALPTDADLETDDDFLLVAAVQDLSVLQMAPRSTDQFAMGTGIPFEITKAAGLGQVRAIATESATSAPHETLGDVVDRGDRRRGGARRSRRRRRRGAQGHGGRLRRRLRAVRAREDVSIPRARALELHRHERRGLPLDRAGARRRPARHGVRHGLGHRSRRRPEQEGRAPQRAPPRRPAPPRSARGRGDRSRRPPADDPARRRRDRVVPRVRSDRSRPTAIPSTRRCRTSATSCAPSPRRVART